MTLSTVVLRKPQAENMTRVVLVIPATQPAAPAPSDRWEFVRTIGAWMVLGAVALPIANIALRAAGF